MLTRFQTVRQAPLVKILVIPRSGNGTLGNASSTLNFTGGAFITGSLSGPGSVTINGSSYPVYMANSTSTYSGNTTLNSGTLAISGSTNVGLTEGPIGTGTLYLMGGIVISNGSYSIANPWSVGTTVLTPVSGNVTITNGNALTLAGNGVITSGSTLTVGGTGSSAPLLISGNISGPGAIVVNAAAGLQLSGSNSYTGATSVTTGGILRRRKQRRIW